MNSNNVFSEVKNICTKDPKRKSSSLYLAIVGTIILIVAVLVSGCKGTVLRDKASSNNSFNIINKYNIIYFSNFKDSNKLYSSNIDGNNKEKVCDDSVGEIKLDGDNIYYVNMSDNSKLYRVKTNSTDKDEISSISVISFDIYKDAIFMTSSSGVYSISKDGLQLKTLSNIPSYKICGYNEEVFFSTSDKKIYSMNIDGSNLELLYNKAFNHFKIADNQIYFEQYESDNNLYLYKANLDDTIPTKICQLALYTGAFDVNTDGIYFASSNSENVPYIYKADLNGSNVVEVAPIEATTINCFGSYLFCYHPSNNGSLKLINMQDGTITDEL